MASKQIPVVGEAFLGSDPLVQKMIRISFGSSGFSGVNDVDVNTLTGLGGTTANNLLTFADSNFRILNIVFNVVEVFSVLGIQVGMDSDPVAFAADTLSADSNFQFDTLGIGDLLRNQSTGADAPGAQLSSEYAVANGLWPGDSDDRLVFSYSGAGTLGTEGNCEVYVFYLEVPDQP
jgi:hypothetical protein